MAPADDSSGAPGYWLDEDHRKAVWGAKDACAAGLDLLEYARTATAQPQGFVSCLHRVSHAAQAARDSGKSVWDDFVRAHRASGCKLPNIEGCAGACCALDLATRFAYAVLDGAMIREPDEIGGRFVTNPQQPEVSQAMIQVREMPLPPLSLKDFYDLLDDEAAKAGMFRKGLLAESAVTPPAGKTGQGEGNGGEGSESTSETLTRESRKVRQSLDAYLAVAQNPNADPGDLEMPGGHSLVEAVQAVQNFPSALRNHWFELQRNANRLRDCRTRKGRTGCRREILQNANALLDGLCRIQEAPLRESGPSPSSVMQKCQILFLAANPEGTNSLALDEECREIEGKIRVADYRDALNLITKWAVQPDDLLQHLNQFKPHVVHFSGHGSSMEEIVLSDKHRQPKPVGKAALKQLFSTLRDNIRLVVLNACFSHPQAEAITEVIDCAIGMKRAIGDQAAITFAASFYRAIGFGRSIQEAFDQGKAALMLEGIAEQDTPELLVRSGVDPNAILLVRGQTANSQFREAKEGECQRRKANLLLHLEKLDSSMWYIHYQLHIRNTGGAQARHLHVMLNDLPIQSFQLAKPVNWDEIVVGAGSTYSIKFSIHEKTHFAPKEGKTVDNSRDERPRTGRVTWDDDSGESGEFATSFGF